MGMLLKTYTVPAMFIPDYDENYVNDGVNDTYWLFETLVSPTNPRPSYRLQVYWEGAQVYNTGAFRPVDLYKYENTTSIIKDGYLYCRLEKQDSPALKQYYKVGRTNATIYKRKIFIDIICGDETSLYNVGIDVAAGANSLPCRRQLSSMPAISQIHYTFHEGSEGSASELPLLYEYTSAILDSESAPVSLVITDDPDVTVTIDIAQYGTAYQDVTVTLTGRNDGSNPFAGRGASA